MPKRDIFIGIDPATKTGLVALEADGSVIEAKCVAESKMGNAMITLKQLAESVVAFVGRMAAGPDAEVTVMVELPGSSGKSGRANMKLAILAYLIRVALLEQGCRFYNIMPDSAYKFLFPDKVPRFGEDGARLTTLAKKRLAAAMVLKQYGFDPSTVVKKGKQDVVDAFLLATVARAVRGHIQELTERQQEVVAVVTNPYQDHMLHVTEEDYAI